MDTIISVLPDALASQIAAGEVVERPASVVKELVENALDAGATRCEVAVSAGGVSQIVVSDNGRGMSNADAEMCLLRHATSKLQRFEDLHVIQSYGFRGEALPSIASVSRFKLRTRVKDADAGVEITSDAGKPATSQPIGMAPGTSVEVNDLFYNVPARRKFLRSTGTESGHVTETVELAALANPLVSFKVERDGRKVRQWLGVNDRAERVRQVTSEEALVECRGERGPLSVEAYLSGPERARQGAQGLRLFINNRPIRHRAIAASIAHAYGSVLERGHYPRGVVYLDLPPALVDINVHPQKAEVRFADPRAVTDAIHGIVSRSLAQHLSQLSPSRSGWHSGNHNKRTFTLREPESAPASIPHQQANGSERSVPPLSSSSTSTQKNLREKLDLLQQASTAQPLAVPGSEAASAGAQLGAQLPVGEAGPAARVSTQWSSLRFLAQVRQTYLVCEGPEGICILDQHAAAERVMFGKLRVQFEAKQVASQSLLFPVTVQLANDEVELFETHQAEIAGMGLEVRIRGRDMVSVHSVPKLLQRGSAERLLRDLLSELGRSGARGFSDAVDKALATMACHAAIRAGDAIGQDEAIALLCALDGTDFAGYCPHGRPIVAFWSFAELERRVNRR